MSRIIWLLTVFLWTVALAAVVSNKSTTVPPVATQSAGSLWQFGKRDTTEIVPTTVSPFATQTQRFWQFWMKRILDKVVLGSSENATTTVTSAVPFATTVVVKSDVTSENSTAPTTLLTSGRRVQRREASTAVTVTTTELTTDFTLGRVPRDATTLVSAQNDSGANTGSKHFTSLTTVALVKRHAEEDYDTPGLPSSPPASIVGFVKRGVSCLPGGRRNQNSSVNVSAKLVTTTATPHYSNGSSLTNLPTSRLGGSESTSKVFPLSSGAKTTATVPAQRARPTA